MVEPELSKLEAMVAEAEAKAIELRPTAPARDRYPALRASRERASAMVMDALSLTDADRDELDRLGREHDAELRRFSDDAKRLAIEGSAEASKRLDALVMSERAGLDALPPTIGVIRGSPAGRRSTSSGRRRVGALSIRTSRRPTPGQSGDAPLPSYPPTVRN